MTIFWKVFRLFKLGNNKFLMVLLWDSLILFMGFIFFLKHAPTQLSTLPKKREHKRSKTAVVRAAKIKGMPQLAVWNNIYQFSRNVLSQLPLISKHRDHLGTEALVGSYLQLLLPSTSSPWPCPYTQRVSTAQRIPIIRRAVCQVGARVAR